MKFDSYQMVTDRICQMLEAGFVPWNKPWASVMACAWSGNDGHPYSLLNQLLLADPEKKYADYDEMFADISGEWVTFKQAIDRGGCVRKGEKGRKVVFFQMVELKKDDQKEDEEKHYYPCLKVFTVFKVSQCDGIEQKFHKDSGTLYEFNSVQTADKVAEDYINREGITLKHVHGNNASYSPALDLVTMPVKEQFKESAEYYSTLFHELAHSTGHPNRLNRFGLETVAAFGDDDYSTEELVAEITASSTLQSIGMQTESVFRNNVGYIQHWLKALRNDKKMIVTAAARAEKAIKLILDIKEKGSEAVVSGVEGA